MADDTPTSILRPLVDDLHARREQAKLGGGEEKIAKQNAVAKRWPLMGYALKEKLS